MVGALIGGGALGQRAGVPILLIKGVYKTYFGLESQGVVPAWSLTHLFPPLCWGYDGSIEQEIHLKGCSDLRGHC